MNNEQLNEEAKRLGVPYLEKGMKVMCLLNPIGISKNNHKDEFHEAIITGFAINLFYSDKAIKVRYTNEDLNKEFGECYVYIEHIDKVLN